MIVVDTSALFALGNRADPHHEQAVAALDRLDPAPGALAIVNYAVAETMALMTQRVGKQAARRVHAVIARYVILWTDPLEHAAGMHRFLGPGRGTSFVDCATVAVMHSRGLRDIFTFDDDFRHAGLDVIPD